MYIHISIYFYWYVCICINIYIYICILRVYTEMYANTYILFASPLNPNKKTRAITTHKIKTRPRVAIFIAPYA